MTGAEVSWNNMSVVKGHRRNIVDVATREQLLRWEVLAKNHMLMKLALRIRRLKKRNKESQQRVGNLTREKDYLKNKNRELSSRINSLGGEVLRLRKEQGPKLPYTSRAKVDNV